MPIVGLGRLHVVLALFCAAHVVRTGQPLHWLFMLLAFALLGSLVDLVAIGRPDSCLERGPMKPASAAAQALAEQRA
jgi:hypothetical protein